MRFVMAALDWMDRHPNATQPQRFRLYGDIQPIEFGDHFDELSELCPSRRDIGTPMRKANALNIEVGQPMPRCMDRSPDGRGAIYHLSGGSLLAYGKCCASGCPRTKIETREQET
jgi:hypothetical protein